MHWVESIASKISRRNRAAKFQQFLRLIEPKKGEIIVDVGVADEEFSESDNYLEKHYAYPYSIVAVAHQSLSNFASRYPEIRVIIADGRELPFAEDEFAIAYSNAVLEHTGSHADQLAFLRELYRVAERGYLTTPNRLFPIEVHTRTPLLHLLLPKRLFDAFLRLIGKGWATGAYMNLLSERRLRLLLEEAGIAGARVVRNRTFGLTITFTVIWTKRTSAKHNAR